MINRSRTTSKKRTRGPNKPKPAPTLSRFELMDRELTQQGLRRRSAR